MITALPGNEANPLRMTAASRLGPPLITLNRPAFDAACAELMRLVAADFSPDAIVGIRTGGLVVAECMARAASAACPVLPVTSRRAGTAAKSRLPLFRTFLANLPRPVVDRLRQAEYRLLIAQRARRRPEQWVDRREASAAATCCSRLPGQPRLLVVDDAVDSGATLAAVLRALREASPRQMIIRSAAITQTLPDPVLRPDYVLYHQTLCRFPWSFDA